MITTVEYSGWFPNLDNAISSGDIKCFGTQRQAAETASQFGWERHIVKVQRRFERVYIIATLDFQPDKEGDIEFQSLRVPALKYVTGNDGIKYQPVIKFRRPYK